MLQMILGCYGDYSFDIRDQIWSLLKEPLVASLCRLSGCKVRVASADQGDLNFVIWKEQQKPTSLFSIDSNPLLCVCLHWKEEYDVVVC